MGTIDWGKVPDGPQVGVYTRGTGSWLGEGGLILEVYPGKFAGLLQAIFELFFVLGKPVASMVLVIGAQNAPPVIEWCKSGHP